MTLSPSRCIYITMSLLQTPHYWFGNSSRALPGSKSLQTIRDEYMGKLTSILFTIDIDGKYIAKGDGNQVYDIFKRFKELTTAMIVCLHVLSGQPARGTGNTF